MHYNLKKLLILYRPTRYSFNPYYSAIMVSGSEQKHNVDTVGN
jgi:hypothetical protein